MLRLLQNLYLDQLSFWLGFLAGVLSLWLLYRLRPQASALYQALLQRSRRARQDLLASIEVRYTTDILRYAQSLHLAAPLFSLDEILVPPRLIAPRPPIEPGQPSISEDITDSALPELPDWPELASAYVAPTLSLAEALQGGANLVLIGAPGSGKSVALAHLATQVARRDLDCGVLIGRVPILIHAADLPLLASQPGAALDPLLEAALEHVSPLAQTRLPGFLQGAFEEGRGLLLLDGLDELPPEGLSAAVSYLSSLLEDYPTVRVVAAADPGHLDGLLALGFLPIPLATWGEPEQQVFVQKWSSLWEDFIAPAVPPAPGDPHPLMLNGWLLGDSRPQTPLECTLRVWGAYAGDLRGPTFIDAQEAFLRRLLAEDTTRSNSSPAAQAEARLAAERLAGQLALFQQAVVELRQAKAWINEFESLPVEPETGRSEGTVEPRLASAGLMLTRLIEANLLARRQGERLSFRHLVLAAYLAAGCLKREGGVEVILSQPDWTLKPQVLRFLARREAGWFENYLAGRPGDLLERGLFAAARWLPDHPQGARWASVLMRQLAVLFGAEDRPLGLRARAMLALALSGSPGVDQLFRQALSGRSPGSWLAALGCGLLRDEKSVTNLTGLLSDLSPGLRRAASLALVAIGDKPALEAIATALLQGDEDLRRAAAEALANHPEEGHPTLLEGSKLDDLLVRRAVVFGLARLRQPWARQALERMQAEDPQWVVKTTAGQMVDLLNGPDPRIPRPLPPLAVTPWLIAFAGQRGIGVAPGRPALELLRRAAEEGNEEQRLAALYRLGFEGYEEAVPAIVQAFASTKADLQEAGLLALWRISAAGLPVIAPVPTERG